MKGEMDGPNGRCWHGWEPAGRLGEAVPTRTCSPVAVGAWRRKHMGLSGQTSLCTLYHSNAHCTPGSAASASLAVVCDGVVKARSGSHRRAYMAL
jgi:hypothetical protein